MLLACDLALPVSIADALVGADIIDERIPAVDCAVAKYQHSTDFVTRSAPGHCRERIEAILYRHRVVVPAGTLRPGPALVGSIGVQGVSGKDDQAQQRETGCQSLDHC